MGDEEDGGADERSATFEREAEPDSACEVACVRVERGEITGRLVSLVRPPRRIFEFTDVHGITWPRVARAPTFADLWPRLGPILDRVEFIAAHNARFDRGVLSACCERAGIALPPAPFVCTVRLARRTWSLFPTTLPHVCAALRIKLDHHRAASDSEACARIVLAALDVGQDPLACVLRAK
ncbi:MAG: exonuclease domain-containing protein [Polyangiaceae bacterium]